nr:hypothetical protein [Nostoc sp. CreGUA01]
MGKWADREMGEMREMRERKGGRGQGAEVRIPNSQCPMPNAQCPILITND